MWWKIVLIILGLVPGLLAFVFSIYACVRVGAKSERDSSEDNNES